MSDPVNHARTAREGLAKGLGALQNDASVPAHLIELGAPIAQAMGALHQIERAQGANFQSHAETALGHLRAALAQLQSEPNPHPAVLAAMESVAGSLGQVHALSKLSVAAPQHAPQPQAAPVAAPQYTPAPAPVQQPQRSHTPIAVAAVRADVAAAHVAPRAAPPAEQSVYAAPHAPPVAYQAAQPSASVLTAPSPAPVQVAALQPAAQQAPTPQPPQVQAAPAPQQAPTPQRAQPEPRPTAPSLQAVADPFARRLSPPPETRQQRASVPVPSPPAPPGAVKSIDAPLGAHSATNFYKGLSGNDIVDNGGLFVATYMIPDLGDTVRLRISLPGGYEFEANALVRWTREAQNAGEGVQPGFGAQFTAITPEARQLVYRYVRNREPLFHDDF